MATMAPQTSKKCPHSQFLPIDNPPEIKGVITPPCPHPTPYYYLGWIIDYDRLDEAWPDSTENSLSNFWRGRVTIPWKKYQDEYLSKEDGVAIRPRYAIQVIGKTPSIVVYIADNYDTQVLNMWRDKQYVQRCKEIAVTEQILQMSPQLQWIRCV